MRKAYLTIDDSPSSETDDLTTFLKERNIPALLFCRGDRLEKNPDPVVRAIKKKFVIGNHAFSHTRFSTLSFDEGIAEIEKTEKLIDKAYVRANARRPGKYFRFPHMDRGSGGWVVDYDATPAYRQTLIDLFSGGLNIDLTPPDLVLVKKKRDLQSWLRDHGFMPPPFPGVTHGWFANTEMAQAVDAMFTFSTSDWMVTPRHAGKWPYRTLDDLRHKIDRDHALSACDSAHIILIHDQDGLLPATTALLDHFMSQGFEFSSF